MTKFITVQNDVQKEKKETVFTHLFFGSDGFKITQEIPTSYEKVIYLGKCRLDGDLFACYQADYIEIYKGIKGEEFND